jgi:hypothetical protein
MLIEIMIGYTFHITPLPRAHNRQYPAYPALFLSADGRIQKQARPHSLDYVLFVSVQTCFTCFSHHQFLPRVIHKSTTRTNLFHLFTCCQVVAWFETRLSFTNLLSNPQLFRSSSSTQRNNPRVWRLRGPSIKQR